MSQPNGGFKVDFEFTEFGRVDCEARNEVCLDKDGNSQACSATRGPHREVPGININTHDLFSFFEDNFGFNTRETVAIMGAHTLGQLSRENSGVDGKDGWLLNNRVCDNEYYVELVGGNGPNDNNIDRLVNGAPNWVRHRESNSDLADFDDQHFWIGLPEGQDGRIIVMLNADIAIVRDLSDDNMNKNTGRVDCNFVGNSGSRSTCPHVEGALQEAARYRFSNTAWLNDFEETLQKMLFAGYTLTSDCDDGICKLEIE